MKLRNKKKTYLTIALVALVAIIIIAAIVAIVLVMSRENPTAPKTEIQRINISMAPKTEYFIGEKFDPTGLEIQVITNDMDSMYFVKYPNSDMTISGFDSSVANEAVPVTVTYKGVSATFNVKIIEYPDKTVKLKSIRLSDNFYTPPYTLEEWNKYGPIFDGVKLILTYSDGTEKEVPMKSSYCTGVVWPLEFAGTTEFTVFYSEGGVKVATTVTVTITE